MNNTSGITPIEYRVLVLPDAVAEKTKGGVILPDLHKDRLQWAEERATVVAVSDKAFCKEPGMLAPAPGDKVLIARHAGGEVEGADGVKYRLVNDDDVKAIVESADG